ncbi:MAG: pentapeptide repeat-containing protein [Actinobacteria bacterium]|nr:pentapeptide repeat-containing protein [Actinomycetota bacterium]
MSSRTGNLPTRPRLISELQTDPLIKLADEAEWLELEINGDFSATRASRVEISGCRLVEVTLTGSQLEDLHLSDCVLEHCELSGCFVPRLTAVRVSFQGCRMSGIVAPESKWEDVEMSGCKSDLASFRMSSWKKCRIEDCMLAEADFYGGSLITTRILNSDLSRIDLSKADLRDVYLHGSTVEDMKGAENLSGVVIGSDQVIPLSLALFAAHRVRVDDDPPNP